MIKVKYICCSQALLSLMVTCLIYSGQANAQSKSYNEEITVIAAFDPIIPDAFKINQNPVINDTTTTVPPMSYSLVPHDAGVQLEIEPLPAVKLVAEPLEKLYRNYIRGGAGNYSSLYGELFASSLRSKNSLIGVHLKHLSSTGKIKDYGPSGNSGQFAELFGRKYFQNHTLSGKAFLDRRAVHFYGYKPSDFGDTVINKDDLKQRYLVIGAEAGFGSNYATDDKLNHSFGLSWYNLTDLYKVKESKVRLSADLNKKYDLLKLGGKQTLGLNTSLSFLSQSDSITKIRSSLLYLNPYITATYKEYSFRAGIGFYVAADSVTNAHIYPMLEAKLELIPAALQLYAGIDGGMERLSVKELSEQNPFMSSRMVMQYSYNKFRAYGGFNSNISRSFNFNGSISSSSCENYPFFVPDFNSALRNNFTLLYDDISVMKLKAEVEFVKADKLRLGLSGGYYNYYKLGNQQHAWYKPDYDAALAASYLMQDKIILKLRLGLNGPVWAKSPVLPDNPASAGIIDLTEKIPAWTDLSLGAEYRFSKAFSAWLNLNNLTNSRHLYWTNYPSYRLNFLGGLSYSF